MKRTDIGTLDEKKVKGSKAILHLRIQGTSSASCVSKIEGALNRVSGVEQAVMSLAQSTVSVSGDASVEILIKTIKQAGYEAENVTDNSAQSLFDEKEKADNIYYKRVLFAMAKKLISLLCKFNWVIACGFVQAKRFQWMAWLLTVEQPRMNRC